MHQVKKPQVADLNPHLTCGLCGGYFVDATTVIECLHSFCKSCIVKYLETSKFCPVCEVQVHKTKPLLNIRPDKTLQNVVYKLVPGLFQREMRFRRDYWSKHPDNIPQNPDDRGEVTEQCIYSSDETICLSLEYALPEGEKEDESASRRFLRCPAAVTVDLLKRLIRGKYGLDSAHAVDVLYDDAFLCDEYSLVDLAYIYNWRRKGPMRLRYRIYQQVQPSIVPRPVNGLDKKTKQVAIEPTKVVEKESIDEPVKEPVKEPLKEPIKEPIKELAKEPLK